MRKRRGIVWIVLGLLLLIGAAGLTLYNMKQEADAGEESEVVMEELTQALTQVELKPAVTKPTKEIIIASVTEPEPEPLEMDGRYYMGLITFPSLQLQLPVQNEWSYDNLKVSPCRMKGTPLTGDLVVLAHNYRTHFSTAVGCTTSFAATRYT